MMKYVLGLIYLAICGLLVALPVDVYIQTGTTWKVVLAAAVMVVGIPAVLSAGRSMWRQCSAYDIWWRDHK